MPERADDRRVEPTLGTPAQPAEPENPQQETVESLRAQLQAAQAAAAEHQDKFLRAKAEAENVRRRADVDVANARKFGIEAFAAELLPVHDSLDLARGVDLGQGTDVVKKVVEGLDLTLRLIDAAFQKFGIVAVNPVGEKFDPERHQAMSMVETDEVPPNHVLKVVQRGYLLNNRLLRPAMVMVAKAKAAPTAGGATP